MLFLKSVGDSRIETDLDSEPIIEINLKIQGATVD